MEGEDLDKMWTLLTIIAGFAFLWFAWLTK